jgi:hypothetical protein
LAIEGGPDRCGWRRIAVTDEISAWNWRGNVGWRQERAGHELSKPIARCGHCGRKLHVRYWGGRGTNARYLCKGDYDDGGQYCIGFGGSSVDRRVGQELLKVIAPLGVDASLRALEELSAGGAALRAALSSKLEQLAYEAKKAFEQCMAVRYGDDQIASVLNRSGYSTGKGMRWNQIRVATARRNHSIAGQKRALPDPERVSFEPSRANMWRQSIPRCAARR